MMLKAGTLQFITPKSVMADGLSLSMRDDGFAKITMNNGENRFRLSTLSKWNELLDQVLGNSATKALLIVGTGKFFSNGIDLDWLSQQTSKTAAEYYENLAGFIQRVLVFPIPTVALINGHAFGGGAFLALACDYRVMRPDRGWLNWPETAIGLRFGDPLLKIARTKVPPGIVQRDALVFAKRLTGEEAYKLQLVDSVVEVSQMEESGKKLALNALGKRGLDRKILHDMKKDVYGLEIKFVGESKL